MLAFIYFFITCENTNARYHQCGIILIMGQIKSPRWQGENRSASLIRSNSQQKTTQVSITFLSPHIVCIFHANEQNCTEINSIYSVQHIVTLLWTHSLRVNDFFPSQWRAKKCWIFNFSGIYRGKKEAIHSGWHSKWWKNCPNSETETPTYTRDNSPGSHFVLSKYTLFRHFLFNAIDIGNWAQNERLAIDSLHIQCM